MIVRSENFQDSSRLTFRQASLADAPFFLRMLNEPDYHRFIGDKGVNDISAAENHITEKIVASFEANGFGLWIVETKVGGHPIGTCGLVNRPGFEHPDLGYSFLSEFHGQGYATEAARAVVEHSEKALNLNQLLGIVVPENIRSVRVLRKCGFERVKEMPFPTTGEMIDLYAWNGEK